MRFSSDLDGAIADYTRLMQLDPNFINSRFRIDVASAYARRGDLKRKQGDITGALTDLDRALQLDPNNSEYIRRAEAAASNPSQRSELPLKVKGGTFVVPVEINGAITLDFIVDSGAADVVMPADVVSTLLRSGSIKPSDFIGSQTYILADGSESPSNVFIIRSLKVGNVLIKDVRCSIASATATPLLGQSFLGNFKSWSIDNSKHELNLERP